MATIHDIAAESKRNPKIVALFATRDASKISAKLAWAGKWPGVQLAYAIALHDLACDAEQREIGALTHDIIQAQIEKFYQYGNDKMFPFSEKQIAVIARTAAERR